MTAVLSELESTPSDALAIAARAQHIRRFDIPRSNYPDGLVGYKKWRATLGKFHAELASMITREAGYDGATATRVAEIVRKQRLASDPEAQTLEDAACIVFVRHHLAGFAASHPRDKVISIIRKTLAKMSQNGRNVALRSELDSEISELIQAASLADD